MPFSKGSVTFRMFRVMGDSPKDATAVLEKIKANLFTASTDAKHDENEYGWAGARHILDAEISNEDNIFNNAIFFSIRIDTNKVPGNVKTAWRQMEETVLAASNPSGFISKAQKKEAKETVKNKCDQAVRDGKFRKTKAVPILWDLDYSRIYCNASGGVLEKLRELFERSFGLTFEQLNAGSLAERFADKHANKQQFEDIKPARFVVGPGGTDQWPEYPWAAKSSNPKNYIGNEFLLWLWFTAVKNEGKMPAKAGDTTLFFDRLLELDCAYGMTGKESLRGDGPNQSPEAMTGLRIGKIPRKAHLIISADGQEFSCTFNPETMNFGSLKMPKSEDAETDRAVFEERVSLLHDFSVVIGELFSAFMAIRLSMKPNAWDGAVLDISTWINSK